MRKATACIALATLLLLVDCATHEAPPSAYTRDGAEYGVTEGRFRGRWWNYYERGRSFQDGRFWAEAEQDFRAALSGRSTDQRWARTYGLHFVPEYFPRRELGITLFYQKRYPEATQELEKSYAQTPTARTSYFLNQARAAWIKSRDADKTPPTVELSRRPEPGAIGAFEFNVAGVARDDTFVGQITIAGEPFLMDVSAQEVAFSQTVQLTPGENAIEVVATDLSGRTTSAVVSIETDLDGPAVSFHIQTTAPGTLRGIALDRSGVRSLEIGGRPVVLSTEEPNTPAHFETALPAESTDTPLRFACEDALGNVTTGAVPLKSDANSKSARPSAPPRGQPIRLAANVNVSALADFLYSSTSARATDPAPSVTANPGPLRTTFPRTGNGPHCLHQQASHLSWLSCPTGATHRSPDLRLSSNACSPGATHRSPDLRLSSSACPEGATYHSPGQSEATPWDCGTPQDRKPCRGEIGILSSLPIGRAAISPHAKSVSALADAFIPSSFAAAAETPSGTSEAPSEAPTVTLEGVENGDTYQMEEIVVDLEVKAPMKVASLELDGHPVPNLIPDVESQRVSRRVRFDKEGPKELTARVEDQKGQVGQTARIVQYQKTEALKIRHRLNVAILGNVWEGNSPGLADAPAFVVSALNQKLKDMDRFDLVDRSLIERVLDEQVLSEALGARDKRLALNEVVPAELFLIGRIHKDAETLHIETHAISTETGAVVRIVDVAGPAGSMDEFEALVHSLAVRIVQEFPLVQGIVMDVDLPQRHVYSDLNEEDHRVRMDMKCIVYRKGEEIRHPVTGKVMGTKTQVLCEGLIDELQPQMSGVKVFGFGGEEEIPEIEVSDYVVTK